MIELRIEDDQGNEIRKQVLEGDEILIGRARGNQIALQSSTVSSKLCAEAGFMRARISSPDIFMWPQGGLIARACKGAV